MYPDSSLHLNKETDDAIYFFSGPFDPLNNWSAHQVRIWGQRFPTVEHAYHWRKFSDYASDIASQIIEAPSPWASMKIERQNREHRRVDWDNVKVGVMRELLQAKYYMNVDVQMVLAGTGKKHIVENSPWDSFWGCGKDGQGKNMMGVIWMDIRSESITA